MIQKIYKKKKHYRNLIYGFVWLLLPLSNFIFNENYNLRWSDYAWFILAILQIGLYFLEHKLTYITITEQVISRYAPFPKHMDISDIIEVKKLPTNYILKSKDKELKINPEYINDNDLAMLNLFLDGLQLKSA
ncbi:conserved hypothetical protein [Formosa agariphila KMM 3901]|uniref:Uncharacterized protein n=1 Tax=Formosa agariphila (strain DSM 15362 / KCTC 12365 / LMG 23005 / KMM 3901 / M-2Alg 35-1) TaxID=1347342 RepID=T2KIY8_FORAG|nr:hypothetical protein [Formosa agariphila]CDF78376.1 conserved hypothetical protein [Formosa agariphila KMM 3901]